MQGNVNRRDGGGEHTPALEVLAAIHLLPERASAHRVTTEQELAVVFHRACHCQFATGKSRFAPAVDALVGLDLDDTLITCAHPNGVDFYIGDFHRFSFLKKLNR